MSFPNNVRLIIVRAHIRDKIKQNRNLTHDLTTYFIRACKTVNAQGLYVHKRNRSIRVKASARHFVDILFVNGETKCTVTVNVHGISVRIFWDCLVI